ncbi:uncharacterized protein LOC124456987 [Xenia sp. Carnegie-2017]|uniref:uncharacterized protein LOC124456987 n=1 Tax=Xenia sp. Carnegie-2017 TaxID=2897299 RepID=UPI001F04513F|nr:uncharacterized protein LOC124456987 [Xenia sp. Carnegie-2017]
MRMCSSLNHLNLASGSVVEAEALLEDHLADIWPDFPCLYDVRCPEFKNRDLRENAYEEIAEKLGKTVEWVKSKIRSLLNRFVKAKKPPPTGSARKNPSHRTIWILEKLQFLAPHVATRTSISNINSESVGTPQDTSFTQEDDDDYNNDLNINESENEMEHHRVDGAAARSTSQPIQRPTTSRKRQAEEEFNLIKRLSSSIAKKRKRRKENNGGNMLDGFGVYVAKALSELDPRTCHLAQNKINGIIFQAQAGQLVPTQEIPPQMLRAQSQRNYFNPNVSSGMPSSSTPPLYYENNASYRDDHMHMSGAWQS